MTLTPTSVIIIIITFMLLIINITNVISASYHSSSSLRFTDGLHPQVVMENNPQVINMFLNLKLSFQYKRLLILRNQIG